jgi:hypothetical protein
MVAWLNNGTYTRAQVANSFITEGGFKPKKTILTRRLMPLNRGARC